MYKFVTFILFFNFSFLEYYSDRIAMPSVEGLKFILIFILMLFSLFSLVRGDKLLFIKKYLFVIYMYIFAMFFSSLFAISYTSASRAIFPWLAIFTYLYYLSNKQSDFILNKFQPVFWQTIYVCLIVSAFNIFWGVFHGRAFIVDIIEIERMVTDSSLPYWNIQLLALTGIIFYFDWRFLKKRVSFIIFLLIFLLVIFSGIRAYFFALISAIVIVEFLNPRYRLNKKMIVIFIATSLVISVFIFYKPMSQKMFTEGEASLSSIRLSDRDRIASFLIDESYNYSGLITGLGAGGARFLLENTDLFIKTTVAHSDYVRVISELGVVGFVIYLWILLIWCRKSIRNYRKNIIIKSGENQVYISAYLGSVFFICIGGAVYDLFSPTVVAFSLVLLIISDAYHAPAISYGKIT